ncbi:hypothetical protein CPC16_004560 [Podila verticillata]|nr:hypothetical protein CPC16_004560 [Podila verticillata]
MSSKSAKKSTATKSTNLFAKSVPKKEAPKKAAAKKHVSSSDESSESSSEDEPPKKSKKPSKKPVSSSESSSESEDEPPKKSKKKAEKSKKKKVVSSSEESSSEDEIVLETIPAKEPVVTPADYIVKLNDGLLAIAAQLAESNANQTKILELLAGLFTKMEVHNAEKEADDDLLATIEDVVARGETIVIGSKEEDAVVHHFGSVGHLRQDSGQLAAQTNFAKVIDNLIDDEEEEAEISVGAA